MYIIQYYIGYSSNIDKYTKYNKLSFKLLFQIKK